MSRIRLQAALERMQFSRSFTQQFLGDLADEEWFWTPPGMTTHIAWQTAHLASSQFGLCLLRVRGRIATDDGLIPETFFEKFRIGSTPQSGAENNPPLTEIRRVFDAVQAQSLLELGERTDADLDVPVDKPHPVFTTLLGAVEWCSQHELVHAGQIALLRRLMGKAPKR